MTPPGSVFVSQFGLQHAQQLALALHEGGMLKAFWSGVPVATDESEISPWLPRYYKERVRRVPIPKELRHHPSRFQILWRVGKSLPLPYQKGDFFFRMQHAYDRWIARQIRTMSEDVLHIETGSLYPALHRLEAQGWIDAEWQLSDKGKRAKYYRLTRAGRKQLTTEQSKWEQLSAAMARVLGPVN